MRYGFVTQKMKKVTGLLLWNESSQFIKTWTVDEHAQAINDTGLTMEFMDVRMTMMQVMTSGRNKTGTDEIHTLEDK